MAASNTQDDLSTQTNGQHNKPDHESVNALKAKLVSRDFRSDTITIPTTEMFSYMLEASRGDDVYEDDDSTNNFQADMAERTGKEAAIYCVSGTMTNQLAIRTHMVQPPHSVLCDARAHVYNYEAGGIAFHSQAQAIPVHPSNKLYLRWDEDIKDNLSVDDNIHFCRTRLICLENTLSGSIFPQEEIIKISREAKKLGIPLHLDGARIFDVAAKTGKSLKELCEPFDSVSLCLSKGIGAPVGSILVGPRAFIAKAKHFRKLFGGGIRQSGLLAAAAKYSFDKVFPQLPTVHQRASRLARELHELGVLITVPCDTNMVFLDVSPLGFSTDDLIASSAALKPYPITINSSRLVLHHQIADQTVQDLVALVKQLKEQYQSQAKVVDEAKVKASAANAAGQPQTADQNVGFAKREYGTK